MRGSRLRDRRTAAWLTSKGVAAIDGVDATPEMLDQARARNVLTSVPSGGCFRYRLPAATYDLVTLCLVDEHLTELAPSYAEAARIAREGAAFVLIGFHPFFMMVSGMPTHFKGNDGEPVAMATTVNPWQWKRTCAYFQIMRRQLSHRAGNLLSCASKSSMTAG